MNASRPPERITGRPTQAALDARVREALRLVDDPIALADGPLAALPVVRRLVQTTYRGRTCPEGIALRALLRAILAEIARDLDGTFVAALAAGLREGRSQAEVARQLGTSEEWLCRRFKPQLVRLVRERLTDANVNLERAA